MLTIYKDNTFIYSVCGKIAEERTKAKLKKLLPRLWEVAFNKLKKEGKIFVGNYEFIWED